MISAVLTGRGFPRYALYNTAIATPITLALYLVLIPSLHATGAALASTISYLISVLLCCAFFRVATAIGLREALVPGRADLTDYLDALRMVRARMALRRG